MIRVFLVFKRLIALRQSSMKMVKVIIIGALSLEGLCFLSVSWMRPSRYLKCFSGVFGCDFFSMVKL